MVPKRISWPIEQLPGLAPAAQLQLQQLGIRTTGDLLQQARSPAQQTALAHQLRLHRQHVAKWVALADLAAVPGVGLDYCGLLLHAGIGSAAQLAQTPVDQLHKRLQRLQIGLLTRLHNCPSPAQVSGWIQAARASLDTRTSP